MAKEPFKEIHSSQNRPISYKHFLGAEAAYQSKLPLGKKEVCRRADYGKKEGLAGVPVLNSLNMISRGKHPAEFHRIDYFYPDFHQFFG